MADLAGLEGVHGGQAGCDPQWKVAADGLGDGSMSGILAGVGTEELLRPTRILRVGPAKMSRLVCRTLNRVRSVPASRGRERPGYAVSARRSSPTCES
ncbi:MAG TPA: hypothetical protein VMV92_08675 [Streptosporangiaceae bacterium]|nr:hypothetical protein [Streptosporangiaceae bacterium]